MSRKVIVAGLMGALVMILWTFLVNGIFGFQAGIDMKRIETEALVYESLKAHVVEPGRYVFNPEMNPEDGFADGPVFSVLYGGMGHEAAGRNMLLGLFVFLLAPLIAAKLLSLTSRRVLSSYRRKLLFFVMIGLLLAIFAELGKFGIGGYPLSDALKLGIHQIALWTAVGLVVAWRIRPLETAPAA